MVRGARESRRDKRVGGERVNIKGRLNAIADALETASKQARLLAAEMEIKPDDVIGEINRVTERFYQKAMRDNHAESGD